MAQEYAMLLPEKVIVRYPLAGIGSRAMAQLIDVFLCIGLILGLSFLIRMGFSFSPDIMTAVLIVVIPAAPFIYFILLEGYWGGQTVGKKSYRIRVVMADGTPITPAAAVYRNLARFADFLPAWYLLGICAMFFNERSQRFGDLLAGTMVVHEQLGFPQFVAAPHRFGVHPFEEQVGSLRGMTIDEYLVIKRLCDRFPEMPNAIQEKMLLEVWNPFAVRRAVKPIPNVHPIYLMEAVVMRFGREHGLI